VNRETEFELSGLFGDGGRVLVRGAEAEESDSLVAVASGQFRQRRSRADRVGALEIQKDDDDRFFVLEIVEGAGLAVCGQGDVGDLRTEFRPLGLVGGVRRCPEGQSENTRRNRQQVVNSSQSHDSARYCELGLSPGAQCESGRLLLVPRRHGMVSSLTRGRPDRQEAAASAVSIRRIDLWMTGKKAQSLRIDSRIDPKRLQNAGNGIELVRRHSMR